MSEDFYLNVIIRNAWGLIIISERFKERFRGFYKEIYNLGYEACNLLFYFLLDVKFNIFNQ